MSIKLDIVTVERLVYSDDVDMVVAPGSEGVLGILPRHAPLLTSLASGELLARKQGEDDLSFAIGGGFMEVQPDKVTVLADAAERAEEIDLNRAKDARDRAENLLKSEGLSLDELARAEAAIRRAVVRMNLAEKRSRKHPRSYE
ncbi:MAG TPA: F0F1 ATP synthase subunit epsilon [Chloroflexi bacterium]|nr:F0F1 ATP synthase subunit epsilon [Chloroflexota bacterium]